MSQAGSKDSLALLPKVDTMKTSQYTAHWRTVSENVLANNHPIALFLTRAYQVTKLGVALEPRDRSVAVIIPAFQAGDPGSTPGGRSFCQTLLKRSLVAQV